jgi:hypothetical protein
MKRTSFGPATVESGKNKGQARTLSFATGISTENANGLPIESGKVSLAISAAQPTVVTFETADEVRSTAGAQFDTFVVEAANARAVAMVRAKLTGEARKLTLPPTDVAGWVAQISESITAELLFSVQERSSKGPKGPRGVKAELANLANAATTMSKEDLLAAIAALAGR